MKRCRRRHCISPCDSFSSSHLSFHFVSALSDAPSPQVPSIEGYLDKQKKKGAKNAVQRSQWQKRWFKLNGPKAILIYAKSHKDPIEQALNEVPLSKITNVRVTSEDPTVFTMEVFDRVFVLKSGSTDLALEWVTTLERARRIAESKVGKNASEDAEADEA